MPHPEKEADRLTIVSEQRVRDLLKIEAASLELCDRLEWVDFGSWARGRDAAAAESRLRALLGLLEPVDR